MKKNTLICSALAAVAGLSMQTATGAEASASVDVASAYVFRGATVVDEVVVQPGLEATIYEGLSVGTWANFNTDTSQFDEIDYFAGYELPIGVEGLSLSIGYCEYTYPTAEIDADREVSLSLGVDAPLSPSVTVAYGIEGPFLEEGLHIAAGISHEVSLGEDVPALGLGATVAYEAGDNFAENGFSYAQFDASTSVGPFSVGVSYIYETDDEVLVVDEDLFFVIGASL